MISVIIPSRMERFLKNTIEDVLRNATGTIEVLPVLDGYEPPKEEIVEDNRVRYIRLPKASHTQKRHGINKAVDESKGDYVMALDAHCLVANGFDEQLVKDHKPNWVQIPRRQRLDAVNWCLQKQPDARPPIDYEYVLYKSLVGERVIHGFKWDARSLERPDVPIDDTPHFQGSCWFMTKDWYKKNNFMQIEGYTGWGQEAEEIGYTTWLNGGEVKTNKNTYYAHLHKGPFWGRGYWMSRQENRNSHNYSFKVWLKDRKDFFINLMDKFQPMPFWARDWKDKLNAL